MKRLKLHAIKRIPPILLKTATQSLSIIRITTRRSEMTRMHNPPHPGAVLREWLGDMDVTEAARRLGVARPTLSRLLNGSSGISAEMALRLEAALNTSPEMWLGLQAQYDLWKTSRKIRFKVESLLKAA
jgi:addiction module HigA family antidote